MEKFTYRGFALIVLLVIFVFDMGPAWADNPNAYISIEVKNTKKVYQEIQKISAEKKVIPSSFSEYTNSKNKKKSINISYEIPKDLVMDIMGKIAILGDVKSQNYHDKKTKPGDIEAKTKSLENYKNQLDKIIATKTAVPEVVTQLNYKIQSLEKEINEYENESQEGYEPKVDLSIQIKESGFEGEENGKTVALNPVVFAGIILIVFIISLGLGFMLGWLVFKCKNKTIQVNA